MTLFLIIIGSFLLASFISLYSFGRFCRRAKGEPSYSLPTQPDQTVLDRTFNQTEIAHPNQSGLMLIASDVDAFAIRLLTAANAGRSLDLQYYIWHDDLTGQLLGLELLKAADRGVRIRILLDDINTHDSHLLAVLNLHPNINIRLFNPTRTRSNSIMRGIEMVLRFLSVNRRMHNKLWIADGRLTVAGGRNIGNEYFGAAKNRNFFDVDLAITGAAVKDSSAIFDNFWNSSAVIPIKALMFVKADALDKLKEDIAKKETTRAAANYLNRLYHSSTVTTLFGEGKQFDLAKRNQIYVDQKQYDKTDQVEKSKHAEKSLSDWQFSWSEQVHIISDPPEKVFGKKRDEWLLKKLLPVMEQARQTLRIISPYFIPGKLGVTKFIGLHKTGVEVDILTNSLVTNDVLMAHGGYLSYRTPLLKAGIAIYELRPFGKTEKRLIGSSGASLHTKSFLVDNRIGFVGSFNFDPRSANLNSEMGVLFDDPEIMRMLQQEFELRSSLDFSYPLFLEKRGFRHKIKLCWRGLDCHNHFKIWHSDPESRWWQRSITKIISILPIKSQL